MGLRELNVNGKSYLDKYRPADRRPELDFGMALQMRDASAERRGVMRIPFGSPAKPVR